MDLKIPGPPIRISIRFAVYSDAVFLAAFPLMVSAEDYVRHRRKAVSDEAIYTIVDLDNP